MAHQRHLFLLRFSIKHSPQTTAIASSQSAMFVYSVLKFGLEWFGKISQLTNNVGERNWFVCVAVLRILFFCLVAFIPVTKVIWVKFKCMAWNHKLGCYCCGWNIKESCFFQTFIFLVEINNIV